MTAHCIFRRAALSAALFLWAGLAISSASESAPEPTRLLRSQDGGASEAPAFLQSRPITAPAEEPRKPRRRRAAADESPAAAEVDDN